MTKKSIAFVCVHNSCRSQIAEALTKKYAGESLSVYSAGTALKDQINQDAVRLMKEYHGIDMEETQKPQPITDIPQVDHVITMGCNVVCPVLPYEYTTEDWGLDDPTGQEDAVFLEVMDAIEERVKKLVEIMQVSYDEQ